MYKLLIKPALIGFAIVAVLAVTAKISGDECNQIYGGGKDCPRGEILIDKLVRNPSTNTFVDNLSVTNHKFTATQEVTFRLKVKNTSNVHLDKVDVTDTLPQELEFVSGPGSYNSDTRQISFEVTDLAAGEIKDFDIKTKVVTADKLSHNGTTCPVNAAQARIAEHTDHDTSQICIDRPVVEKMPDTGPADWLMLLTGSGAL